MCEQLGCFQHVAVPVHSPSTHMLRSLMSRAVPLLYTK